MKAIAVLPFPVSPLTKLSRWLFLISGIFYGIINHKKYSTLAANFKEEEKRMKIIRAEGLAREEALRNEEIARELAEALTGLRVRFERDTNDNDMNATDDSTSKNDFTSNEGVKYNRKKKSD